MSVNTREIKSNQENFIQYNCLPSLTISRFIEGEGDLGETMRRCGFRVRQLHLSAFPYSVRVFHDCRWKTSRI